MAVAVIKKSTLSFDRDLQHAYTPCSLRLQSGAKSLDGVLQILQMRIDAEQTFTNSLQKIIGCSTNLMSHISPTETLRKDGLDALYSDLKNEYTQRMSYLSSLKEDVQKPLMKMKEWYHSQNKIFTNQTKANIQSLKKQQNEFLKLKAKYDKVIKDNADNQNASKKAQNKHQQLLNIKTKYTQQQLIWSKQQQRFDYKMISTLKDMEKNEYKRMNALRDAVTNWSAYITNLAANRSYDIQNLARSMALINVEQDLQCWMQLTLQKYPTPTIPPPPPQIQSMKSPKSNQPGPISLDTPTIIGSPKYSQSPATPTMSSMMLPTLRKNSSTEYLQSLFKQKFQKQSLSTSSVVSDTPTSSMDVQMSPQAVTP